MKRVTPGAIALAAGFLAVLALPLLLGNSRSSSYVLHVAVQMLLLGMLAMSWDLVFGYLGLFSFGHAAFYGVAGYTAGMLVAHAGVQSGFVALLAGVAAAAVVGAIVGFLCTRVGSVAVFLVTFACAEAIYLITITNPFGWTNGDNGLLGVAPKTLLGVPLGNPVAFYYLTIVIVGGMYFALRALMRSHFGRVVVAIRENEQRVRFAGYSVHLYKIATFVVSAVYAGVAGVLTTFHEKIASPEQLSWAVSSEAVLYTTLGGAGTLLGPVVGASTVILVRELLSDHLSSWLMFVALSYLVLIFFLPQGLLPLLSGRFRERATSQQQPTTGEHRAGADTRVPVPD